MQTIQTKYLGATQTKGERIKATTSGGISKTIALDYGLSTAGAHRKAVQALLAVDDLKYWTGTLVGHNLNDGMIWVFEDESALRVDVEKYAKGARNEAS